MKKLKYILFSTIMFFLYINNMNAATCVYNKPANYPFDYTITCITGLNCTANFNNKLVVLNSNNTIKVGDTCPSEVYSEISYNQITSISLNSISLNRGTKYKNLLNKELSTEAPTQNPTKPNEPNESDTPSTDTENASAICTYEVVYQTSSPTTRAKITCNANDKGVNCTAEGLSVEATGVVVTPSNFKQNNVYSCPSNIYAYIDAINKNVIGISPIKGTEPGWESLRLLNNESKDDGSGSSGETTTPSTEPNEPSTNEEPSGDFDPERFCKGPVQGVFTTLGWVFFAVKIIIPIMLIIFGSIDVGKAVIASKDDEIKKSVKTLAVRAIAGIIIFFIPTILGFIVKMIDNNDIYKGTFWDCTKCMLDPMSNVCSGLRGEE